MAYSRWHKQEEDPGALCFCHKPSVLFLCYKLCAISYRLLG